MTSILLIYPFFKPPRDRSVFRFPPLGISYIAASLREAGHQVTLIDCTFLDRDDALNRALATHAEVVGIYCMVTMLDDCLWFAHNLREASRLLVAGGPLPSCDPTPFLDQFDIVVRGEGEQTILDLLEAICQKSDLGAIPGIVYRKKLTPENSDVSLVYTKDRLFTKNLDHLPFPARDLLPNEQYIQYTKKKYGYSITTVMSTRGCPFRCEFCSNVVFGGSYRERSPGNVVDEIEQVLKLGYERISFAEDVFTLKRERVISVCEEILRRGLQFKWECLGRADSLDLPTAHKMKQAGCTRIYFGVESADEGILQLMNKEITPERAQKAVEIASVAGIEVGAFFILFYPGDTEETVLRTLHFATSLPLDYIGLSMPYPLPGTAFFERVKDRVHRKWRSEESLFGSHVLTFDADFSEFKMWFGIIKGHAQFRIKKSLGKFAPIFLPSFEKLTDGLFRLMK